MQHLECDVLVVGGGLAGCWAALRARDFKAQVILAERGIVSRAGVSPFSGAGLLCPSHEDNLDAWHRDMVVRGKFLNDQEWIKILLEEQPARIEDMAGWGIPFERDNGGNIVRCPSMGSSVAKVTIIPSLKMMECLKKRAEDTGVKLAEKVMITDLLTSDGCHPTKGSVTGAFGFQAQTGEPCVINSKATVLATGGLGYSDLSGDGIALAFRAGAEIYNMEFIITFDKMGFEGRPTGFHFGTFHREGFTLWNSRGERFMERYYPQLKEMVNRHELALAILIEEVEGRGPVYMDLTHLGAEGINRLKKHPATYKTMGILEKAGIDISKKRVRFNVFTGFLNYTNTGGIRHNTYAESSLRGLFVAGEAGGYPARGCGSVGPLAMCCVGGYRAGEYAARCAVEKPSISENKDQIKYLEKETFGPFNTSAGLAPEELLEQVNAFLSPPKISVFRNKENIARILVESENWKERTKHLKAGNMDQLIKANKLKNYIQCAELIFRASQEREESRGVFIRTDYPFQDDLNGLKYVVLQQDEKWKAYFKTLPLPVYRYQVRPESYSRKPFSLPVPSV